MAIFKLGEWACLENLLNANSDGRKKVRSDQHHCQNLCCSAEAALSGNKVGEIKPE